jgi:hypothetical protein
VSDVRLRKIELAYGLTGTLEDYAKLAHERVRMGIDSLARKSGRTTLRWKQFSKVRFYNPFRLNTFVSRGAPYSGYWFPNGGTSLRVEQIYRGNLLRLFYVTHATNWGDEIDTPEEPELAFPETSSIK